MRVLGGVVRRAADDEFQATREELHDFTGVDDDAAALAFIERAHVVAGDVELVAAHLPRLPGDARRIRRRLRGDAGRKRVAERIRDRRRVVDRTIRAVAGQQAAAVLNAAVEVAGARLELDLEIEVLQDRADPGSPVK